MGGKGRARVLRSTHDVVATGRAEVATDEVGNCGKHVAELQLAMNML